MEKKIIFNEFEEGLYDYLRYVNEFYGLHKSEDEIINEVLKTRKENK